MKYVFFDVAGTLLEKPALYSNIERAIKTFGYEVNLNEIKVKHRLLSEIIYFPDRTSQEFYEKFNSELLYLLGIVPTKELLDEIFNLCTYLPWQSYEDTSVLAEMNVPVGIISNFNTSLKDKLRLFFDFDFQDVLVSEELGFAKPSLEFYQKALDKISCCAADVLYIGDSIKLDLEPAVKIGFNVLIIDRDEFYPNLKNRISNLKEVLNYL